VFAPLADERFPAIRDALGLRGSDPRDRDAFLMEKPSVTLIRDLRPEEGLGDGMDQLVALVHHAYLFWAGTRPVISLDRADLGALLDGAPTAVADPATPWYLQLPVRRVWAQVLEGAPHEPLDGCFVHHTPSGALRVLGAFGLHPDRDGFSVVEAEGPRPGRLERPDGSRSFQSLLAGGATADLHSLAGAPELLELGWRSRALARQSPATREH
jgi:hypothetical protein